MNVASVAGLVGLRRRAAYCAAKGAVIALTRALAVDHVGEGVRVNCICPGTIDTPWVRRLVEDSGESLDELRARQPMGRLGTAAEVADAAAYLAGDEAGFATGTVLALDGGLTAAQIAARLWVLSEQRGREQPEIDCNFLAEDRDARRMLEGVRLARTIGRNPTLAQFLELEILPGQAVGDDQLAGTIASSLTSYGHQPGRP